MISYCGMLLSSKTELPQTNGAPLFVSVRQNIQSKSAFGSEKKEDAPFNKAIPVGANDVVKLLCYVTELSGCASIYSKDNEPSCATESA